MEDDTRYYAAYKNGQAPFSGDTEDGGDWFAAGDIYGYENIEGAREALKKVAEATDTQITKKTTTWEVVE